MAEELQRITASEALAKANTAVTTFIGEIARLGYPTEPFESAREEFEITFLEVIARHYVIVPNIHADSEEGML